MKQGLEPHNQEQGRLNYQNQFLKTAFNALAHPFIVINARDYVVEMANNAAYSGDQAGMFTCYMLLHGREQPCSGDDHPCPLEYVKKWKKPVIMEHRHLNTEGQERYVEVHGHPIFDTAGSVIQMIEYTLDITERKRIEKALQDSENNWRSLTENSPDHILMLDTDLRIQFANLASPGLTLEDLIGVPLYTLVDKDQQSKVKTILEGVLKDGKPAQYETVYHLPDGGYIFYESHVNARTQPGTGEIVGLTLAARDITPRKEAQQELQNLARDLGERIKELNCLYGISKLVAAPGISLEKILQGTVDLIPPSWQYPEITCARISFGDQEFRSADYQESPWRQTAEIVVQCEPCGFVEVIYLQKKPAIDEGPFLKEERHLIDAIAERLGTTIEHIQAEERAHSSEIQLAAIEERERIGRELHDDLAQVIGSINALSIAAQVRLAEGGLEKIRPILDQLVQVSRDAHADVRHYILGMRASARAGGLLANQNHPSASFPSLLEGYLETLYERYGLETQLSLPDDWIQDPLSPQVETQLLRIIQEALTNVSKHAGVNQASLTFTMHSDEIQVIVEDKGSGFNVSNVLSEMEAGDSTHFGLGIMIERAQALDGRLEIRSTPGKGTQIIARMPALMPQTQPQKSARVRVLLVDDHPLYLEGLRSMLAARGFQIVGSASDGFIAQSLARDLRPDLILMDVNMPRCNGLEAARIIKQEFPETKIVMLTVDTKGETLLEALKNGASGYLLKSLDGTQFFNLLSQVLDGETVLSPELASMVLEEFTRIEAETPQSTGQHSILTARQNEVLELSARGLTNKEIAAQLNVTEATVKYHISQILERLQLKSRYQLGAYTRGHED